MHNMVSATGGIIIEQTVTGPLPLGPPPWVTVPPSMQAYEERRAGMLSKRLWEAKSFCYSTKPCKYDKMGRVRSVPYGNRDSTLDDGYLDELYTTGRDDDE